MVLKKPAEYVVKLLKAVNLQQLHAYFDPGSYLPVKRQSPVWRVLGQEVEPDAGENLLVVLVFPQQLNFADGYHVRLGPDFDEEKLSQGQDPRALVTAPLIPDSLVECVRGVVTDRRSHKLKKQTR